MNTFCIKKEHLDKDNFYVGKEDLSNYQGHIEAQENLGTIRFENSLRSSGNIYFRTGSGIEAGNSIKAGWGIEAGNSIEAGGGIEAGNSIEVGYGIEAGWGIKAGNNIEAGYGIKAGCGIEAGCGIKAGWGIEAGWGIVCKLELSSKLRIFAGLVTWRMSTKEEMQIKVGKLVLGQVCYGELIETGLPKEDCCDGKVVEIEGKKYQLKAI